MPDIRLRLTIGAAFAVWFWLIYGAANWWTGTLGALPDSRTPWDAMIPFRPGWAWIYLTVSLMLVLPLAILETGRVMALALVLSGQTTLAGLCFLLWPVAPSAHPPGAVPGLFALADAMNLTYNSAPSLHIALSVTCAGAMMRVVGRIAAVGLALWAAAITLAALLTHQHYLIDAVGGLALAGAGLAAYPAISHRVKKSAMSRRIAGI